MIHRIETGWLQVNDALTKRERRQRRQRGRRQGQHDEHQPEPMIGKHGDKEPATIDLMA
jgi:hypothetical protein